jgi:aminopeptidase N
MNFISQRLTNRIRPVGRGWHRAAIALAVMAALGATAPAIADTAHSRPGSAGLGDPLFPLLGNGGYNVEHYDLSFNYDPASRVLRATTVIESRATQPLSRFDLDFAGNAVQKVVVEGRPAGFTRTGEELVVTPHHALRQNRLFHTIVTYTGTPTPYQGADPGGTKGFFPTADGFFVAPQPQAAHSVFPANDYPSDKATMTFHLTVPTGMTAVANGVLTSTERHDGNVTWNWQEREPIATELVTMAVGHYTISRHAGPHGVALRDVVPTADANLAALHATLSQTASQMAWLERRLGPYPFGTYGLLAVDANIGFAEEDQTLTVFRADWLAHGIPGFPAWEVTYGMAHELTHQWFGDSVTPRHWSDAWLNEGPAVFYGTLYTAEHGGPSLASQVRDAYAGDQQLRDQYGPPAAPKSAATLYSDSIYSGGSLTLYALRGEVGPRTFDKIMRTWVTTHRGGSASTADFIRTASQISGSDLTGFLRGWLYGATTPPMPTTGTAS